MTRTSHRQTKANRFNAQKSTGPRTQKGKAASRRNALKHGLTARSVLLAGEAPAEFRRLQVAVIARFKPEGVLERELATSIASLFWRLRRVPPFEAALLAVLAREQKELGGALLLEAEPADWKASRSGLSRPDDDLELGIAVREFLQGDYSGKLSRYEASLQKRLSALLQELRDMQEERPREGGAPPAAPGPAGTA